MAAPAQIRYVPRHIAHHGLHAGYDRLFEHMALPPAANRWFKRLGQGLPRALAWRLWALRPQATQAAGLGAELGALPFIASGRQRLCHFIYGEDTWFYSPLWKKGSNRCVATFHYPPQRLLQRINPGSVAALDAAIIVGSNQRTALEALLPPERVHLCLHPVDTEFFCPAPPAPAAAQPPRLVCAGNLFRDYPTLLQVHRRVRAAGFELATDVIGPGPAATELLRTEPGIQVLNGLDDTTLRDTYRRASVGVLPLLDGTANNALLEMLACGLPIVSTAVGGTPDYTAGSRTCLLPPGDAAGMAEAVCQLLANPGLRQAQGQANRAHAAQTLSYAAQARRMREVYALILGSAAGGAS